MSRFNLGRLVATPGALQAVEEAGDLLASFLLRHARGDWGIVDRSDWQANDAAVADGSRILSAYLLSNGLKVWVITEAQDDNGVRESTCLLLPGEY